MMHQIGRHRGHKGDRSIHDQVTFGSEDFAHFDSFDQRGVFQPINSETVHDSFVNRELNAQAFL